MLLDNFDVNINVYEYVLFSWNKWKITAVKLDYHEYIMLFLSGYCTSDIVIAEAIEI